MKHPSGAKVYNFYHLFVFTLWASAVRLIRSVIHLCWNILFLSPVTHLLYCSASMLSSHCVSSVTECCQVMFDYKGQTDDELDLKKGDVVMILKKVWGSIHLSIFKILVCDLYFPMMSSFFNRLKVPWGQFLCLHSCRFIICSSSQTTRVTFEEISSEDDSRLFKWPKCITSSSHMGSHKMTSEIPPAIKKLFSSRSLWPMTVW